jgi:hypothetical protein
MINNLEIIKQHLKFDSEDDFYHLQIIKRKKEHPELGSNSYIVKTYYIRSIDYLERKMPEIIALCDFHNARGCINLNRRSFEKIAFHLLRKVADQIMNKDFKSARKAYESVCGAYSNESEKKWIIDIDVKDEDLVLEMVNYIQSLQPDPGYHKALFRLETKNGYHLITKPFKMDEFMKKYPEISTHKDNPTCLYIP